MEADWDRDFGARQLELDEEPAPVPTDEFYCYKPVVVDNPFITKSAILKNQGLENEI